MSGLINLTFPYLLRIAYKRKGRRRKRGLEKILLGILYKTVTRNTKRKVNVGYYSGGGPNHSKFIVLIVLPVDSSRFIAVPQPRGADDGVSSNSTPTISIVLNEK